MLLVLVGHCPWLHHLIISIAFRTKYCTKYVLSQSYQQNILTFAPKPKSLTKVITASNTSTIQGTKIVPWNSHDLHLTHDPIVLEGQKSQAREFGTQPKQLF